MDEKPIPLWPKARGRSILEVGDNVLYKHMGDMEYTPVVVVGEQTPEGVKVVPKDDYRDGLDCQYKGEVVPLYDIYLSAKEGDIGKKRLLEMLGGLLRTS